VSEACTRWARLSDRAAVGEAVDGGDAEFLRAHGQACAECGAERELWAKLPGALSDSSALFAPLVSARALDASDALVEAERERKHARRRRAVLALSGFGLAAGAALGFGLWRVNTPVATAPKIEVRLAFVSGDVTVNQAPARAGLKLDRGDGVKLGSGGACLLLEPGVTVCAHSETEFVVERTELERRRLRLLSGSVVARLAPQPKGATFGIETAAGAFVAKGTSFAVEIGSGGVAELRVHEGTVSAEPRSGSNQALRAPAAVSLGAGAFSPRPLSSAAAARDARLLQLSGLWSEQASCELDISASPGGQVTLDGMELGQSPLTALVTDGGHRLALSLTGFGPVAERLTLARGERVARRYELTPLSIPAPVAALPETERTNVPSDTATPSRAIPLSADELLSRAREQRAAGRYGEAAGTYRRLLSLYPRSDQARAALVSLGELELSQLGNADSALASFDAYLRGGGALAQEARYGRIRALRKLGRLGDERSAIEAFLRDYPRSVQATALRARLLER
jgi:tetratricopeptide (TPR) repeat protein